MFFVVFGVREKSECKNLAGVEVNGGNQAEIVFADIENDHLAPRICIPMIWSLNGYLAPAAPFLLCKSWLPDKDLNLD